MKRKWEPLVGISVGGVGPLIKCLSYRSYPQTPEPNGSQQSGKARAAPPCTQRERGRCVYEKRLGNHPNRPVDEGLKPIGLWYASGPRIMSLKPTNYGGCNPKTAFFPSTSTHTHIYIHIYRNRSYITFFFSQPRFNLRDDLNEWRILIIRRIILSIISRGRIH